MGCDEHAFWRICILASHLNKDIQERDFVTEIPKTTVTPYSCAR
jgi:hypothetical protein